MLEKYKEYAPIVVRYGIGIVFLLIGLDQAFKPESWTSWLPSFASNLPISGETFFFLTGIFNTIVGVLLLIGLFTRIAAFLAALHLVGVMMTIGYNDVFIRDLGLFLMAISVLFFGADKFCLDNRFRRIF